jgi:hypothetical protein
MTGHISQNANLKKDGKIFWSRLKIRVLREGHLLVPKGKDWLSSFGDDRREYGLNKPIHVESHCCSEICWSQAKAAKELVEAAVSTATEYVPVEVVGGLPDGLDV